MLLKRFKHATRRAARAFFRQTRRTTIDLYENYNKRIFRRLLGRADVVTSSQLVPRLTGRLAHNVVGAGFLRVNGRLMTSEEQHLAPGDILTPNEMAAKSINASLKYQKERFPRALKAVKEILQFSSRPKNWD